MTVRYFRRTPPVHPMVQYVDTIENFRTESVELIGEVPIIEDPVSSGKIIVIVYDQVHRMNLGDWIGYVDNQVEVHQDNEMQGYGTTFTEYTPPTPPAE